MLFLRQQMMIITTAVAASVVIDVVKADPVLSWAEPSDIVYGTSSQQHAVECNR